MIQKGDLNFGDIVWTEFDPSVGHEYQDRRPAIVVQSKTQLFKSNLATVIPLTSKIENKTADDILIHADVSNKLHDDSVAKVYCITSFDYSRFRKKFGKINIQQATAIKEYLIKHFDL